MFRWYNSKQSTHVETRGDKIVNNNNYNNISRYERL